MTVFHLDGTWASGTGTSPNGSYLASGLLAPGSYRVQFSPPPESPYSPEWYNNKASQDSAHAVVVTVPNITSGIDAVLDAGGIITVLSANGGENWQRGSTRDITWAYAGNPGEQVKIQLLKGGKVSKDSLSASILSVARRVPIPWDIPADQAAGTNYQIKVTSTSNSAITDTSDANFTISLPPPLTVLAPNGGEDWKVGSKHTIQWKYTVDIGTTVKIQLLRGDSVVKTIESGSRFGCLGQRLLPLDRPQEPGVRLQLPG